MAELAKEYRAFIRVRLTDDLLPSPVLSKEALQTMLEEALETGSDDSPVISVSVVDPRR